MVDISEEQLRILNGSKALLDRLLSGKTRRRQEQLIKEHYPETQTTDDIAEPYTAEIKELKKSFEDFKAELKGNKLDDRLANEIDYLKTAAGGNWTEDGIEKLKKLMIEREIPSIKDAAAVWDKRNPPQAQQPSTFQPSDWGIGRKTDDPDTKLLFEDEDAWADQEARKVWHEETVKKGQIIT
jgi:hypothetical protein